MEQAIRNNFGQDSLDLDLNSQILLISYIMKNFLKF